MAEKSKLCVLRIHTKYKYKNKKVFVFIFKNLKKATTDPNFMDRFLDELPLQDIIKFKKSVKIIDREDNGTALYGLVK